MLFPGRDDETIATQGRVSSHVIVCSTKCTFQQHGGEVDTLSLDMTQNPQLWKAARARSSEEVLEEARETVQVAFGRRHFTKRGDGDDGIWNACYDSATVKKRWKTCQKYCSD